MRRRNLMALILLVPFLRELVREDMGVPVPATPTEPRGRGPEGDREPCALPRTRAAQPTPDTLPPATVERVLRAVHYEEYEQ